MNYENFNRVLTHIEQHPEEWNQFHEWGCGTAYCFLGHAHNMSGHPDWESSFDHGRKFLGISDWLATWLYNTTRTLDDFRRVRQVLALARLYAAAQSAGEPPDIKWQPDPAYAAGMAYASGYHD